MKTLKKTSPCTKLCLILAILAIIIMLAKHLPTIETFDNNNNTITQTNQYSIKHNDALYDKFYATVYDSLVYSDIKNDYEITALQNKTGLTNTSYVLDVGSGTGRHCSALDKLGCSCVGIDKSEAMITKAKENAPNSKFVKGDVQTTMTFQGNSFTHITVFYFTIYYIKDKTQFFKNAYHWLSPGGYVIIHLVNKHKFDPIIPAGDPLIMVSAQKYTKKRITNTTVEFDKFKYKANFNLKDDNSNSANFDEKFIFPNGQIRHNQHTLWMDSQEKILGLAKETGFILESKIDLIKCQYNRQYLYILQKPN